MAVLFSPPRNIQFNIGPSEFREAPLIAMPKKRYENVNQALAEPEDTVTTLMDIAPMLGKIVGDLMIKQV